MIQVEDIGAVRDASSLSRFLNQCLGWETEGDENRDFYDEPEIEGARPVVVRSLVQSSTDDPFLVLLAEYRSPCKQEDLYDLLARLRRTEKVTNRFGGTTGYEDTVFIVAEPEYRSVRFVKFEERKGKRPRSRTFGWDVDALDETRTVREFNLESLRLKQNLLGENDWEAAKTAWPRAWDVGKLTNDFFIKLGNLFREAQEHLERQGIEDSRTKVQILLNRLLFLRFLERRRGEKGQRWLDFDGSGAYLRPLYIASREDMVPFWPTRLWRVFQCLNHESGERAGQVAQGVGRVPYLNGGLFEDADSDALAKLSLPNEFFDRLLGPEGLLYAYNFTIRESTPDNEAVAIDPEVLGRVFEKLVTRTDRHGTGSYYTPREVVSFMAKEAIKNYLHEDTETPMHTLVRLVEESENDHLTIPQADLLLKSLKRVRAVDPACGSGAYLVGLLHELVRLNGLLENRRDLRTASEDYDLKLEVIENNVYGVDKEAFAVNTAMLRLWLSLMVEDQGGEEPKRLPNLKYKIECGDSLSAPDPSRVADQTGARSKRQEGLAFTEAKEAAERYTAIRRDYGRAHGREKARLEAELETRRLKLKDELKANLLTEDALDWRAEFPEVFFPPDGEDAGFDIVLANPPYVRADEQFRSEADEPKRLAKVAYWKAYRETLKKHGPYATLYEKWDLFIPFFERAYQMLKPGGQMAFIVSDAYNGNKYALRSHEFFLENSVIRRVEFCSEIKLFDAAVANTILIYEKAEPSPHDSPTRVRRWGDAPSDFEDNFEILATMPQTRYGSTLFRPGGQKNEAAAEGTVPLEEICYISVGAVLHANEKIVPGEFKAEDLISPTRDDDHPKPFFEGKNMGRWVVSGHQWLEYDTARSPKLLRRPTFPQLYEVSEKLVSMDLAGVNLRVVYDAEGLFHNHSAWSFVPWRSLHGVQNRSIKKTARYKGEKGNSGLSKSREELEALSEGFEIKYLLGVMNSAWTRAWMAKQRGNKMHVYPNDWKKLPIVKASEHEQQAIVALVQRCLDKRGMGCEQEEKEIDERVAALYATSVDGVSEDHAALHRKRWDEVRSMILNWEDQTTEFKEILHGVSDPGPRQKRPSGEVALAIASFLNSETGGCVVLGVRNREREVVGIDAELAAKKKGDFDAYSLDIYGLQDRFDRRPPSGSVRVEEVWEHGEVGQGRRLALIRVTPAAEGVVYQPSGTSEQIVVIRDGPGKRQLSMEESLRFFKNRRSG